MLCYSRLDIIRCKAWSWYLMSRPTTYTISITTFIFNDRSTKNKVYIIIEFKQSLPVMKRSFTCLKYQDLSQHHLFFFGINSKASASCLAVYTRFGRYYLSALHFNFNAPLSTTAFPSKCLPFLYISLQY